MDKSNEEREKKEQLRWNKVQIKTDTMIKSPICKKKKRKPVQ